MTFRAAVSTGIFKHLSKVDNMNNCTKLACTSGSDADFAFLLDGQCFSVKCYSSAECEIVRIPPAHVLQSAVARLVWSGRTGY